MAEFDDAKLDGLPDPRFRCPYPDESVENHMTDEGEHVCVYEGQVPANGNGGFNGEDGYPMCCACGYDLSEHKRVDVSRAEADRR